jgi:hypothetical protein
MGFKEFLYKRSVPGPKGYMEKPIDRQKFLENIEKDLG